MGADYIEQDVALSSDGVLVCLHDDTLDRTARGDAANCSGSVSTKTLAQLKTCDMGSWFNEANPALAKPEFVGLQIPTLEEVFQRYALTTAYYIETKIAPNAAPMEAELFRLIGAHGLRDAAVNRRQVLIQSFSSDSLVRLREFDAELPLVQLAPIAPDAAGLDALSAYAFGVGPSFQTVSASFVDNAHARGLAIHPYTVNSAADLERVGRLCVDGMFTNFPDRYRGLVDAGTFACPPSIR
jgi:glycerophosphoryl diester phosphodiesterase